MLHPLKTLQTFDFTLRTRVVFGPGILERLGGIAAGLGWRRALLVADQGVVDAGHVSRAAAHLREAGLIVSFFHDFDANPNSRMVEAGRQLARGVDGLVALGGGSSLDCAKGIGFLAAGGGSMRDYRGYGKARGTLLPSIGIPTTAGTGSEAQSYAIISDADTHEKMACGDPQAAFRVAILDPQLTVSAPRGVTAVAGFDALSHAVESYVTTKRSAVSLPFAREAWRLLQPHYARVLETPDDLDARAAMLLGAHYAGMAIEQSMLGAAHACANPLTATYGTTHGHAIAVMLPHIVRWNAAAVGDAYAELMREAGQAVASAEAGLALAALLDELAARGALPRTLRDLGASRSDLDTLSTAAATQWTGTFNPTPFDRDAARTLYDRAF